MPDVELNIERAAKALNDADALLITAGAGMGVDSGLPDFRGPEGFWRAYPAVAKLGLNFEQIANPSGSSVTPSWLGRFTGIA
jgi:NAD-dependent SIR2 family protein deacetylase